MEHINYFNLNTFKKLCDDSGLHINNISFTEYHGKMLRIIISKKYNKFNYRKILFREIRQYRNKDVFKLFQNSLKKEKIKFIKKINKLRNITKK